MNFAAQIRAATSHRVLIVNSRLDLIADWSGSKERVEHLYSMSWLCKLRLIVEEMEEGRKRVLRIMASILVPRHLKTTEDLHDSRPSPRTEALVGSAVQWGERIMRRIDGTFANLADEKRWPRT